jgi:hypothetical protein
MRKFEKRSHSTVFTRVVKTDELKAEDKYDESAWYRQTDLFGKQ